MVTSTSVYVQNDGMWVTSCLQEGTSLRASGIGAQMLYSRSANQGGTGGESSETVFEVFYGGIGEFELQPFQVNMGELMGVLQH